MELTLLPDKVLSTKTQNIPASQIKNGDFRNLVLEMKDAMKKNKGVGLAANQIGQNLSIFVIDEKLAEQYGVPNVYFNPEISEYSRDKDEIEEGCLSIPGFFSPIPRSKKIKIKAVDENGNKIKFKARGFLARVLQHETDHLNGVTIKEKTANE